MSTKAIRELMSDYLSVCAARNSEYGKREPDSDERGIHQAALAEVEAIEKAAKAIDTWCNKSPEQRRLDADALRGFNLMSSIAKEAK